MTSNTNTNSTDANLSGLSMEPHYAAEDDQEYLGGVPLNTPPTDDEEDEEAAPPMWTATQSESRSEASESTGSVTTPERSEPLHEEAPPARPPNARKPSKKTMGKPSSVTLAARKGEDTGDSWAFKTKLFVGVLVFLTVVATVGMVVAFAAGRDPPEGSRGSVAEQNNQDGNVFEQNPEIFGTRNPTSRPTPFIPVPTATPTAAPTGLPTTSPTPAPTSTPSAAPSSSPTPAPTSKPSASPTFSPTPQPTPFVVETNAVPPSPPRGYFNYDDSTPYGPNRWGRVDTRNHWLKEFTNDGFGPWKGHFGNEDLTRNICDGPDRKQSPKNLVGTVECEAGHEIRTECATDPLVDDDAFQKVIEPHKLTIISRRRPCLKVQDNGFGIDECRGDRPPMVDYPRYASSGSAYSDLHHVDLKVPGEHRLQGESFDAEMQLYHTHLSYPRISAIGVPIRATSTGYNEEFQWILESFEVVYARDAAACEASQTPPTITIGSTAGGLRRRRELAPNATAEEHAAHEQAAQMAPTNATLADELARKLLLLHRRKFNPYSDSFLSTMFFYRYDGSITEPPCRDITWWVMDAPMIISFQQLNQLQKLLFTHVAPDCTKTSVHNPDMSVSRPIFPLGEEREIEHCPEGSFRSDISKGRPPAKRCRG